MSRVVTDAGANTSTGNKRTPPSAIQQGPAHNKLRMDTKLAELKAKEKAQASQLKKKIELELQFVKGKDVASEPMLEFYCAICDDILKGETLDEHALVLLKRTLYKKL
jgi:hypothetical protein